MGRPWHAPNRPPPDPPPGCEQVAPAAAKIVAVANVEARHRRRLLAHDGMVRGLQWGGRGELAGWREELAG